MCGCRFGLGLGQTQVPTRLLCAPTSPVPGPGSPDLGAHTCTGLTPSLPWQPGRTSSHLCLVSPRREPTPEILWTQPRKWGECGPRCAHCCEGPGSAAHKAPRCGSLRTPRSARRVRPREASRPLRSASRGNTGGCVGLRVETGRCHVPHGPPVKRPLQTLARGGSLAPHTWAAAACSVNTRPPAQGSWGRRSLPSGVGLQPLHGLQAGGSPPPKSFLEAPFQGPSSVPICTGCLRRGPPSPELKALRGLAPKDHAASGPRPTWQRSPAPAARAQRETRPHAQVPACKSVERVGPAS